MSKLIEDAQRIEDLVSHKKSVLTADPKRILKEVAIRKEGVIVEIPWDAKINGEYQKTNAIVITKVTKERVYFNNPIKVSEVPCKITEADKKGPPRTIDKDNLESMSLVDFFKLSKKGIVIGIVSAD